MQTRFLCNPKMEYTVIARRRRLCCYPVGITKPARIEGGAARQCHDWIAALRSQ